MKLPLWLLAGLLVMGCQHAESVNPPAKKTDHPKEWWAPVDRKDAPPWEILPQDAGPGEVILSKRTQLGRLSNFAFAPFILDNKKYQSIEGFWQMMKFPEGPNDERAQRYKDWPFSREAVSQMTAFEAKHAGDAGSEIMKRLGINWVTYQNKKMVYRTSEKGEHYQIIRRAMIEKLRQNPEILKVLLATRGLKLRPDHDQGKNPPPPWRYYEIYTELRDDYPGSLQ